MNRIKKITFFLIPALIYGTVLSYCQSNYRIANDYSFTILGSSNIRDWLESVDDVDGIASITGRDDTYLDINEVRILIRTNSIKSVGIEGNAMNKKTYETLKTVKYPVITFITTSPILHFPVDGKKHFIEVTGMLTIAGMNRIIKFHPALSADRQGKVYIEGQVFLKMTDFALEPPVTLFGTLKVKDDIAVQFKMNLIPLDH
ncbi:MAG: YceI family protein [Chitinophagaceae bacterium]|nr:MAG: YceI family protein [Chitinophagaceae bacterium]